MDKIFFIVNPSARGCHWSLVVAYMQEKTVRYYDSMRYSGNKYVYGVFRYLQDEHLQQRGFGLQASQWKLFYSSPSCMPQQPDGVNCGVFALLTTLFIAEGYPLVFDWRDMDKVRRMLVGSLLHDRLVF